MKLFPRNPRVPVATAECWDATHPLAQGQGSADGATLHTQTGKDDDCCGANKKVRGEISIYILACSQAAVTVGYIQTLLRVVGSI